MIIEWLSNVLFGKDDKVTLVVRVSKRTASKVETLIDRFNDTHHDFDHIDHNDVAEFSFDFFCNKALKLNYEVDDLPSTLPAPPIHVEPTIVIRKKRNAKPIAVELPEEDKYIGGRAQAK